MSIHTMYHMNPIHIFMCFSFLNHSYIISMLLRALLFSNEPVPYWFQSFPNRNSVKLSAFKIRIIYLHVVLWFVLPNHGPGFSEEAPGKETS